MFAILANAAYEEHDTIIFWGAITLICIVPTAIYYWYRWRKVEIEAELKHEMIVRGMSADEIVRVLEAKTSPGGSNNSPGSINVTQHFGDKVE